MKRTCSLHARYLHGKVEVRQEHQAHREDVARENPCFASRVWQESGVRGRGEKAVGDPEYLIKGRKGEILALRWCTIAPKGPKYLCVIYKELKTAASSSRRFSSRGQRGY